MNQWQEILDFLQTKVDQHAYQTWLRPTVLGGLEDDTLTVHVPNREFKDWIEEQYGEFIEEAKLHLHFESLRICFAFDESSEIKPPRNGKLGGTQGRLDFESVEHSLMPRYTFENFVVGPCNQFAHAAARAVAEQPATSYNPFFVYGGVGLGKTHLIQAVGHEIKKRSKETRLAYVSSEKFTNELISAFRYKNTISFRDKYRNVDVLLIDDIQFIAGKESIQEEFFHTFNDLYEAQKQVVISSDCVPKEIPKLEERLRSRFAWGLTADLQPPDLETRLAILQEKAKLMEVVLPEAVALFIATKMKSSIRDLEGALIRLVAYSSLTGADVSLPMAQQVLKNLVDMQERRVSIEIIQRTVAQEFGLTIAQLKARSNSRHTTHPRQIAMYLAKELTPASLPQIGREFGGKHHTTVLHSINRITELRKSDKDLDRIIHKVSESLR